MTKIRKQKRNKTFRYNVNRKRMRNKQHKVPKIQTDQLKEAWDKGRSVKTNLTDMGLVYDSNKSLSIPSIRDLLQPVDPDIEMGESSQAVPEKQQVAIDLEKEAKRPRSHQFRLPNNQLHWVTYLLDKYGEDYKAMSRDARNYNQETWKQIRAKIKQFQGIPEQYTAYLQTRSKTNAAKVQDNKASE